jgi:hypothetical protein
MNFFTPRHLLSPHAMYELQQLEERLHMMFELSQRADPFRDVGKHYSWRASYQEENFCAVLVFRATLRHTFTGYGPTADAAFFSAKRLFDHSKLKEQIVFEILVNACPQVQCS